ncbi:MAG: TIGR04211 family SH3 domain-containing protein [Woeseia sp.]
MRFLLHMLLLAALPMTAMAETAYVTDQLILGLHRAADTSDRAFRTLESGQEMEILTRNRNYAQVRLPDGTEGYVKVAYLVTEKPAKLIVSESQAESERLQQELDNLRAAFAEPAQTIERLEQQLDEQQAEIIEAQAQISDLAEQNEDFAARQDQYKYSLPVKWVGGALAVVLLAGFLGGLWWTDYRSRKRHGGIRIY